MKQVAMMFSLLTMLAGAIILEPAPESAQDYVGVALVSFGWFAGLVSVGVWLIWKGDEGDLIEALEEFLDASTNEWLYQTGQFSREEVPPSNYPSQGSIHGGLAEAGKRARTVLASRGRKRH